MDFLSPVLGAVTGIEPAHWKEIALFSAKALLFIVPFVIIGLLVEKDIVRLPVTSKLVKLSVVLLFTAPVFMIGALNYFAPGLPDEFWDRNPLLESFWIMEGKWTSIILMAVAAVYVLLYAWEVLAGDMTK